MAHIRKNKDFNPNNCGVTHFLNRMGGKWKVLILYAVSMHCNRFSLLQQGIPDISKQTLVNQLREMEADGILQRTLYPGVPARVEYNLTDHGMSLMPVIEVIQQWGFADMGKTA